MAALSDSPGVLSLDGSRRLYLDRITRLKRLLHDHGDTLNYAGDRMLKRVLWSAFLMCVDLDCADEAREILYAK